MAIAGKLGFLVLIVATVMGCLNQDKLLTPEQQTTLNAGADALLAQGDVAVVTFKYYWQALADMCTTRDGPYGQRAAGSNKPQPTATAKAVAAKNKAGRDANGVALDPDVRANDEKREREREEKIASLQSSDHLIPPTSERLITREELKKHDMDNPDKVYWLAVLGQVFDVSQGANFYSGEGGYTFFSGTDASRAYVTGEFKGDGLTPDVVGLSAGQVMAVYDWLRFYINEDKYPFIGLLANDTYFDAEGKHTDAWTQAMVMVGEAKAADLADMKMKSEMPPCNSQWTQAAGGTLWCSRNSGGIPRNWVGLPRKYTDSKNKTRCACVEPKAELLSLPSLAVYRACHPKSVTCRVYADADPLPQHVIDNDGVEQLNQEPLLPEN